MFGRFCISCWFYKFQSMRVSSRNHARWWCMQMQCKQLRKQWSVQFLSRRLNVTPRNDSDQQLCLRRWTSENRRHMCSYHYFCSAYHYSCYCYWTECPTSTGIFLHSHWKSHSIDTPNRHRQSRGKNVGGWWWWIWKIRWNNGLWRRWRGLHSGVI